MSNFSFARDDQGRDVLVGLTAEETTFCTEHRRRFLRNEYRTKEDKARYRDLMAKHDRHRFQIISVMTEKEGRSNLDRTVGSQFDYGDGFRVD
jgi:hypothetical protein